MPLLLLQDALVFPPPKKKCQSDGMLSLMNVKAQHDIFWEDSAQTQEQAIHLIS